MVNKYFLIIVCTVLFFQGCFEEEKPKKVVKKQTATSYIVNKVPKVDSNKTLSEVVENDGIVIDGSHDEHLLDAFGLAVSQVIVEDGVSVPDCSSLSKTGHITIDECKEISEKYFGFYEIDMLTGDVSKVDDVFKDGIAGSEIAIRDSDVELFDSSGNPLLNNRVEFEQMVDNSDDPVFLENLAKKVPKDKTVLQQKINSRLDFLNAQVQGNVAIQQNVPTQQIVESKVAEPTNVSTTDNEAQLALQAQQKEKQEAISKLNSALSRLSTAEMNLKRIDSQLLKDPNNAKLIADYNEIQVELAQAQQDVQYYEAIRDSLGN